MTLCIVSIALRPRYGLLECPDFPVTASFSIMIPLCIDTGRIPVGSPIIARRATGLPAATKALAPRMEDSSSAVAMIMSGCRRFLPWCRWSAAIDKAKKLFMSQHPKPTQELFRSVSANGSLSHNSSSHGTVSVCPARTRPPGPVPSVAIRLAFLSASFMISHLKPNTSK